MARTFDVPAFYRSPVVSRLKEIRREADPLKRDLTPSILDCGPVRFKLARHFGFCYGVENAIEIAYRTLAEHSDKRIFLLSEMIHNPRVNDDLRSRGIRFLRTTQGEQLIPFDELSSDDIVIVPAFGTTVEIENLLESKGLDIKSFDTTCPFVEKVWKRSTQIGQKQYTVVVHGKRYHEETRATFSHAEQVTSVVVVRDLEDAGVLGGFIRGDLPMSDFFDLFAGRYSEGFDPEKDLKRIGVVNQTTMLATETAEIADLLKGVMEQRYGRERLADHFADTSDTLCYATNENQSATRALIDAGADLALVVGGPNSSNTSHLAELCEEKMPTYFISGAEQIVGRDRIEHYDLDEREQTDTGGWLSRRPPVDILLTAGASCPDILLDEVMEKILSLFDEARSVEHALRDYSGVVT